MLVLYVVDFDVMRVGQCMEGKKHSQYILSMQLETRSFVSIFRRLTLKLPAIILQDEGEKYESFLNIY